MNYLVSPNGKTIIKGSLLALRNLSEDVDQILPMGNLSEDVDYNASSTRALIFLCDDFNL